MSSQREPAPAVAPTERHEADETPHVVTAGVNSRFRRPWSLAGRLFLVTVVAAMTPIAVATVRAIRRGWIPVGDDAFFTVRARDVFTLDHLPLLGTWSSASLDSAQNLNHPGPLLFDVLALPARIGGGNGLAIGAALINAAALLGIAIIGYRRGGAVVGAVAVAVGGVLAWSMGSEVLFEPWQPHVLLLPFLCFVMLVWAVACGDLAALPWAAGVGSFVVQTHLSYAILVPLLGAWAILGAALVLQRVRRAEPGSWPALRRRAILSGSIAVGVFVVCWLQPLIEQFTSDGDGNLTRLAEHARNSKAGTVGFGFGTRAVASVVSLPPWWGRPSFETTFSPQEGWRPPSLPLAVGSLFAVAVLLAWCWWSTRRRHDRDGSLIIVTAVVALACGLISAGRTPTTVFGTEPHVFRWLWPLGAFVAVAIAVTIVRRFARASIGITGACAVVAVVFGILNLPTSTQGAGPNSQQYAIPTVRELDKKMGALAKDGPLLIDDPFSAFANPYAAAVLAELQERGISFVAKDPVLVRQLGPGRRYVGHNARNELLMRTGDAAFTSPAGSRLALRGSGLSRDEQRELSRLQRQIRDYVAAGRLRLNSAGRAALARGELPVLQGLSQPGGGADAQAVLDSRELVAVVDRNQAVLRDAWLDRFERYAVLQKRFDTETVALFVRPLPSEDRRTGGTRGSLG